MTMSIAASAAAAVLALSACSSSSKSSGDPGGSGSGGPSGSTIKIGYISNLTGPGASSYGKLGLEGAQARVDLANASGGVNGHKIELVSADDQSNPTGNVTAAQSLIETKGVFGIVSVGVVAYAGAKYINKKGVPLAGDGNAPQYTTPGYDNMFSYQPPTQASVIDGKSYTWNDLGKFLKTIGVTRLATEQVNLPALFSDATLAAAASVSIPKCLVNKSIPLGGVDFTAAVLALKNKGCDGVYTVLTSAANQAFVTAARQAGLNAKLFVLGSYNPDTVATPASAAAFEGTYTLTSAVLDPTIDPGAKPMVDALVKYAPGYKSGEAPNNGMFSSYLSMDLMIKGLEVAGQNPTRESFIKKLQTVSDYTAGGVLPSPTDFSHFGTPNAVPQEYCHYYLQIKGGKFVAAGGGKICGSKVSYTPSS